MIKRNTALLAKLECSLPRKTSAFVVLATLLVGCQTTAPNDNFNVSSIDASTELGEPAALLFPATLRSGHMSDDVYLLQVASATAFEKQASQLTDAFGQYCQAESISLDDLKEQWSVTMQTWMALQGQQRGPQSALDLSWNIQFWPDKKNTTGRKMQALAKHSSELSAQRVLKESVTVQGLGAIEWLLYDTTSPMLANKESGCQLGEPISEALQYHGREVSKAWQQNPWTELDEKHWRSEYVSLLSNQIEYSMKKLSRPLAKIGQPRPYFAESWRSGTSLANLGSNVDAMDKIYHLGGLDSILRERGRIDLANSLSRNFTHLKNEWPKTGNMFETIDTKSGYQQALMLLNQLELLDILVRDDVALELGIVVGFNATDGD